MQSCQQPGASSQLQFNRLIAIKIINSKISKMSNCFFNNFQKGYLFI